MAIKYLDAKRLQGTNAERLALATTPQTNATSWKLIDRSSTLESVGSGKNIRVPTSSGSFTAKDNMMIITNSVSEGSMTQFDMNFNEDFNTNYWWNLSTNASSGTSQDDTWWIGLGGDDGSSDNHCFSVTQLKHIASKDKVGYTDGCFAQVGSANVPSRRKVTGKWTPSSSTAITDITYSNMNGASGSMSSGEVLVLGCDDDEADSGTPFFEWLTSATLDSVADTISTSTFAKKNYLFVEFYTPNQNDEDFDLAVQFNDDTTTAYADRFHIGFDGGSQSAGDRTSMRLNHSASSVDAADSFASCFIINKTGQEKMMQGNTVDFGTAGADTVPDTYQFVGKWANTSDKIEKITFFNMDSTGTAEMGAGTSVTVWGAD